MDELGKAENCVTYDKLVPQCCTLQTRSGINLCRYNKDHLHLKYPIPKPKRSTTVLARKLQHEDGSVPQENLRDVPILSERHLSSREVGQIFKMNLIFRGLCIAIYSYNKSQRDAPFLSFIWYKTPYVSYIFTSPADGNITRYVKTQNLTISTEPVAFCGIFLLF
jgi:hypothetical protein